MYPANIFFLCIVLEIKKKKQRYLHVIVFSSQCFWKLKAGPHMSLYIDRSLGIPYLLSSMAMGNPNT